MFDISLLHSLHKRINLFFERTEIPYFCQLESYQPYQLVLELDVIDDLITNRSKFLKTTQWQTVYFLSEKRNKI